MQGACWERELSTMTFNNVHYLKQNVFFNTVVRHPGTGLSKGVNHELQVGVTVTIKVNNNGLILINIRMAFNHLANIITDCFHQMAIAITNTQVFINTTVGHARWVFHHDGGKQRISNIQQPFVESANAGQAPADVFHRAFNFTIWRAYPVTNNEKLV